MVKALLFDFSRTLLFPKDKNYKGNLNELHKELSKKPNYEFLDHFELNKELTDYLLSIKEKVPVYMFTSESIQEVPEIKNNVSRIFTEVFSAKEIGLSKNEPKAYEYISRRIGLMPSEILFIDDSQKNQEAAKSAGLKTLKYEDNRIIKQLDLLIK